MISQSTVPDHTSDMGYETNFRRPAFPAFLSELSKQGLSLGCLFSIWQVGRPHLSSIKYESEANDLIIIIHNLYFSKNKNVRNRALMVALHVVMRGSIRQLVIAAFWSNNNCH